jgi:hypothetical protein
VTTPTIRPDGEKVAAGEAEELLAELRSLEERYRHELMDDEERQELRDRVLRLRNRGDCSYVRTFPDDRNRS